MGDLTWSSPEVLGSAFGLFLTLFFTLFPGVNTWFAAKPDDEKRQWMGLIMIAFALAGGALSCGGIIVVLTCTKDGIILFILKVLIPSVMANQTINLLVPKPKAVKAANIAGKVAREELPPPAVG